MGALEVGGLVGPFATVVATIFVAELTDKDALLLLSLGARMRPLIIFAAGAIAFAVSSAVIVLVGSELVGYVPIIWVKLAGGVIMLAYAGFEFLRGLQAGERLEKREGRFMGSLGRREAYEFLGIIASLIVLDLAGDATELITVVFVAQFDDALLVFAGAVLALVAASALETILGSTLARFLSTKNVRYLSIAVFLLIGTVIILSSGLKM